MTHRTPLLLAFGLAVPLARAQTNFAEVEPNNTKPEATVVQGITAGDTLTGSTTGTDLTPGLPTDATADMFRLQTAGLPPGIWFHALTITTGGTAGHTGTIRGRNQVAGGIGTTDVTIQFSSASTVPARTNTWYGFGRQEEIYYRVHGTAATTAPYTVTLSTIPVAPVVVPGSFQAGGTVTVTTVGQTALDTEIYVYDANLDPVPTAHNDDEGPGGPTLQSRVTRLLAAGTYYAIVSDYNVCNDQTDANVDEDHQSGPVLDRPGSIVSGDYDTGTPDYDITISDGTLTTAVTLVGGNLAQCAFAVFTVIAPGTPTTAFCFGDGSGTPCPCGNAGWVGNGCASSVNPGGANLASSGVASVSGDTLVLSGAGMPDSSALYFQATLRVNNGDGAVFGDGLRCAAGALIRLGTKVNVGGASSYPSGGDSPVSVKGSNAAGNVRDYQVWYRNAALFCTSATFNLTNGLELTWTP